MKSLIVYRDCLLSDLIVIIPLRLDREIAKKNRHQNIKLTIRCKKYTYINEFNLLIQVYCFRCQRDATLESIKEELWKVPTKYKFFF